MQQGVINSVPDVSGEQTLRSLVEHWSTVQPKKDCLVYLPNQDDRASQSSPTACYGC